ncbi:hypothetical protein [Variovorax fucosicus]|uniref:hypothetical protein n=1 Tax=Variovorax fucosicus TaxID=3053517 RepID=UPI002578CBE9|nr:hypothetical protein [Variovorax sp. J22G47]MDM0054065.1 hypothetical protein [Variovorax sp. J22G47]
MFATSATKVGESTEVDGFLAKMFNMSVEQLRAGILILRFATAKDVEAWVAERPDGELALRFALATHKVSDDLTKRLAEVWLLTAEQSRTDARAKQSIEASERAAAAAEASAKWTLVAAIVAAVSTVVTAAGVIVPAFLAK